MLRQVITKKREIIGRCVVLNTKKVVGYELTSSSSSSAHHVSALRRVRPPSTHAAPLSILQQREQRRFCVAGGGAKNIGCGGPLAHDSDLTASFYEDKKAERGNFEKDVEEANDSGVSNNLMRSSRTVHLEEKGTLNHPTEAFAEKCDDDFDDLSGITFIRTDPEVLERKKKTRLFIQRLFTVPTEQEAVDMIYAAANVHKTLKPHHLTAMVNEARRQKYAWIALRESGDVGLDDKGRQVFGQERREDDNDDDSLMTLSDRRRLRSGVFSYQKELLRRQKSHHDCEHATATTKNNNTHNSRSSNSNDDEWDESMDEGRIVPLAYPPTRAVVLFNAAMDAGFLNVVRCHELEELLSRGLTSSSPSALAGSSNSTMDASLLPAETPAIADSNARFVVGRELEGLVKLLLEDVLRSDGFKQWDDKDENNDSKNTRRERQKNSGKKKSDAVEMDGDKGLISNHSSRTKDDAAAAWSIVALMSRFGLRIQSPKVIDALEVMLAAGVSERLAATTIGGDTVSGGGGNGCPELERHRRQSYQLSVANRAEFLHEQRERLATKVGKAATTSGREGGRRGRDREPSSQRI